MAEKNLNQSPSALGLIIAVMLILAGIGLYSAGRYTSRLDAIERRLAAVEKNQAEPRGRAGVPTKAGSAGAGPVGSTPSRPASGPDPSVIYAVPIDDAPSRGDSPAWVTIVEFGEYQCPYCARAHATLAQLLPEYGSDVRLVWRHLPLSFHEHALPAAHALECAHAQQQFWPLHDALFAGKRDLSDDALSSQVGELAGAVNLSDWRSCFTERRFDSRIRRDQKLAEQFGIRGTPSFFINGRYLGGAQPIDNFRARIDEELARARTSGTPRASYYATAVMARGQRGIKTQ